jgi:hypothetical protein
MERVGSGLKLPAVAPGALDPGPMQQEASLL